MNRMIHNSKLRDLLGGGMPDPTKLGFPLIKKTKTQEKLDESLKNIQLIKTEKVLIFDSVNPQPIKGS